MVKVAAPMMSVDASGTIANSLTFSKWKGRNYVRTRVIPANPRTASQTGIRSAITFLSQAWASLDAAAKATWEALAKQSNVAPFNAYVGQNAYEWRNGLWPSQSHPAARSSTPPTTPTATATASQRTITIAITAGATAPSWGYSIHRASATGLTTDWTTAVAIVPKATSGTTNFIDSPLKPGTYYYKVVPFNADGKQGTASTEVSATVT